MKYLHLIWAALFRRKARTILTLVSIMAAFLLFGMLDAVSSAFSQAGENEAREMRLQVSSRVGVFQPLPHSLLNNIETVGGVKAAAPVSIFMGSYQRPGNIVVGFAVGDSYLGLYPRIEVDSQQRAAFETDRQAVLIGKDVAVRLGWKVGDQVPVQAPNFPTKSGSKIWTFRVAGVVKSSDRNTSWANQLMLVHWSYLDELAALNGNRVSWFVVAVSDPGQSSMVAKAIDSLSMNSDHETRTLTEQQVAANLVKQLADISLIVNSILTAVFFTLLLLSGNTMMQAVRERTSELAVLKTIGFSNNAVLGIVLAESVLLLLLGGVIGLALASLIIPGISANSGGMLNLPVVGASSWILGVVLMIAIGLLVGALPAIRAMRLNIVDALAGR